MDITLTGLRGNNPLGYLAGLGVLAILEHLGALLEWTDETIPKAVLHSDLSKEAITEAIMADAKVVSEWSVLSLTNFKINKELLDSFFTTGSSAEQAFRSAMITDITVDGSKNIKPTDLYFLAGTQSFTGTALQLIDVITPDQITETLYGPWSYSGKKVGTFMWDSRDDRNYALMARNPSDSSNSPKMTMPGADWLAFRGLGYLPAFGTISRVYNPGISGGWKRGAWAWALWRGPISGRVVRSLLQTLPRGGPEVFTNWKPPGGVFRAYQSQIVRSDQGGYGTARPPKMVWSEQL